MNNTQMYDIIIIGSGSAGMTAGIYAGRSKLKTLILDHDGPGGQIKITSDVSNYPGIENISGAELSETMRKQAQNFGVEFVDAQVIGVDFSDDIKVIKTDQGDFKSIGVIIATGAKPRTLGFIGEEEFRGHGIGYCATCDGQFFTGLPVFVIGAGFAAAEESIYLTRYASKVTVIAREPEFTCSKSIADKVLAHPKIEVKFNTEIVSVTGDTVPRKAEFINNLTGEKWTFEADPGSTFGVFVFVGYIPQSEVFKNAIKLDQYGYIPTDETMKTNIDGVYAAGDIRPKNLRQLVTAVSDGAIAATEIEHYIDHVKEKLGIQKQEDTSHEPKAHESLFTEELKAQLQPVFNQFQSTVTIASFSDGSQFASEIEVFLKDLSDLTDKVQLKLYRKGEHPDLEEKYQISIYPAFVVLDKDNKYTRMQFHGIPGGHEINSLIYALYNAAGPGQQVTDETMAEIMKVKDNVNLKVGITLSCPLCPDVVAAAHLMALKNPNIQAEMVDVGNFAEFRTKYNIMSVPALIINDEKIALGKRNIKQIVELINS